MSEKIEEVVNVILEYELDESVDFDTVKRRLCEVSKISQLKVVFLKPAYPLRDLRARIFFQGAHDSAFNAHKAILPKIEGIKYKGNKEAYPKELDRLAEKTLRTIESGIVARIIALEKPLTLHVKKSGNIRLTRHKIQIGHPSIQFDTVLFVLIATATELLQKIIRKPHWPEKMHVIIE